MASEQAGMGKQGSLKEDKPRRNKAKQGRGGPAVVESSCGAVRFILGNRENKPWLNNE